MTFNSMVFGKLHQVVKKEGKNGAYHRVTVRNEETFVELTVTFYEDIDLFNLGVKQGDNVALNCVARQKGFDFDLKGIAIEKVGA